MGCPPRRRAAFYEAYRRSNLTLEEFEGPRYQRIGHIQKLIGDGVLDMKRRHRRASARERELARRRVDGGQT